MAWEDTENGKQYNREYQRKWRAANPLKVKDSKRRSYAKHLEKRRAENRERARKNSARTDADKLRNRYGLTVADFQSMLEAQGHVCAICTMKRLSSKTKRLFVDHCHTTGKVRGLLCTRCNSGLGMFAEDGLLMKRAIAYLEAFNDERDTRDWLGRVRRVLEKLPAPREQGRCEESMGSDAINQTSFAFTA
jgi:hypothetical protein